MHALRLEAGLRPSLEPCDVYKLVFQSVMGADHLLASPRERVSACLVDEWNALEVGCRDFVEPPVQVLDPETGVVRLHLRPLKLSGAELESVLEVVLGQPCRHGRMEDVVTLWRSLAQARDLLPDAVRSLDLSGFEIPDGAPHHSARYGPASYRVLNDWSRLAMIRFDSVGSPV